MSTIYKHTFKATGKSYIGKTSHTIEQRLYKHLYSANNDSETHFHRAIRKYGIDDITSVIIEDNIPEELIDEREIFWIANDNTFGDSGYNMTEGGDGGNTRKNMSDTEKLIYSKKISDSNKGRRLSDDHKRKLSEAKCKNPTALSGKQNGRAKQISIYDKNNNVVFETHGNFTSLCKEHDLPKSSLFHTLYNHTTIKTGKFKGWYARKKETQ